MKLINLFKTTIGIYILVLIVACKEINNSKVVNRVSNIEELKAAIKIAQPGDNIVMANGVWRDAEIKFVAKGEKGKPITLLAETSGKVTLEGQSCLKLGGNI